MESGNSGSFQSSTGDEEFDSHGDGISALINNNQQKQPPPPPPPPPCYRVSSYMYDDHCQLQPPPPPPSPPQPLENYQRSFMNSSYVLDWSNNNNPQQRSETNSTNFNHMYGSAPPPSRVASVSVQQPPPPPPPPSQEARKPRKRSRASRGAATTVLTTDTTNFRAMVQEFTGIPEPPFQKNRLGDIFGTVSGITSPPYLRRPFPQKLNPPFSSSSSFFGSSSSSPSSSNINNYHFNPQSYNIQNQFLPSFLKTHQESRVYLPSNDDFSRLISSDQRISTTNNINHQDAASVRSWGGGRNGTGSNQDDDQTHATNTNFSFSSS